MQKILLLFIFLSTFSFSQTEKTSSVTITVYYTLSYCGGARPNPEILEKLNTPRPLANCFIKLVPITKEKKAKTICVKTNDKGEIIIKLQNYKYQVFIGKNKKNNATLPFNKKCDNLSETVLTEFDAKTKPAEIQLKFPCDPCDPEMKKRQ